MTLHLASDSGRDGLADFIGGFFSVLFDFISNIFGFAFSQGPLTAFLVFASLFLLWRFGLIIAPLKICWRCKGNGHYRVLIFGRRACGYCNGTGTRNRTGASSGR